ncbi:MAG: nucleotidyltransferase domain-containing protein [Candidatus Scalindua sp.]|jgi:predicted nucleotidyltransferase|nr:nucleotidyltransferase domain-containing protein [Candidatus Scalindua sp.]MBT6228805.1 nucleotidyltransferase domain-containing protein [Candidatus Scalindua sp.]MBT6561964.1 nucleotidyltransferase domain-containing protein [Candidatus Scalindua sp.]MBT7210818.1 nucleotidyltransferase domain-containing protein [Candidatus Scalindua sp.]
MKLDAPLEKAVKVIVQLSDPEKIILFGSRAGKDYKDESDYDLLVLKKGLIDQRQLVQEIYLNFKHIGAPVDVIAVDIDRFEELKDDPDMIYNEAFLHGNLIYEKS